MIKKLFLSIIIFANLQLHAQTKAIELGDVYYDYFQYDDAIRNYEQALTNANSEDIPYILRQLAYCYQYSFRYIKAEEYYTQLIQSNSPELKPEDYLDYGKMLKLNGKYDQAKEQFQKFDELTKRVNPSATLHLNSVNWAMKNQDVVKPALIYPTNLNISGQSLGYALFEGGLIYARSDLKQPIGTMPVFDLAYAKIVDSLHFEDADAILQKIDFEANEGAPSITRTGALLYFNANASKLKNGKVKKVGGIEISEESVSNFKIYVCRNIDNSFSQIQELAFNDNRYNCVHPAITEDGSTLYFASDMPGGYGGLDLYMVRRNSEGAWGAPQNLGSNVNTEENELFPFVHQDRIYFSSKGLNGYGGYDIYTARIAMSGMPASPQNMGKPFNSFRDDMAYITYEGGRYGYFSTNRDNNEGKDAVYFFHDLTNDPVEPVAQPEVVKPEITALPADTVQAKAEQPADKPQVSNVPPSPTPGVKPAPQPVVKESAPKPQLAAPAPKPDATVAKPDRSRKEIEELYLAKKFNHGRFELNSTQFDAAYESTLDTILKASKLIPTLKIEINGHADSRGNAGYNKSLSLRRANKVKSFLIQKGVPAARIRVYGHGEEQLINGCADGVDCSEEDHAKNRRTEIRMTR